MAAIGEAYDANKRREQRSIEAVTVDLVRRPEEGWGIKLTGTGPCYVEKIKPGGPADYAGLQAGDCILAVNGQMVIKLSHDQVVSQIREAGKMLRLKVLPQEQASDASDDLGSADADGFGGESGWGGSKKTKKKTKKASKKKDGDKKSWWDRKSSGDTTEEEDGKNPEDPFEDLDTTDFDSFCKVSDKFDKKLNKKIRQPTDFDTEGAVEYDSDEEYIRFRKMKKKLKMLGKINELDSDDDGADVMEEFKEFMRYRHMVRNDPRRTFASGSKFDSDPMNRPQPWDDSDWKNDTTKYNGTNYQEYNKMQDQERAKRKAYYEEQKRRANAVKGKSIEYNGKYGQGIEQDGFIVTHQDARDWDENYEHQGTFQGRNAAVAGAFTGEHNVVVDEDGDVKGVANRVKAGIQHFNFDAVQELVDEKDKGKVIVYTTSLGVNRIITSECAQVVSIIRSYRVRFEERDIWNNPQYKDELYEKLGLDEGDPFPAIPKVYIDGLDVGGLKEIQAMNDCGDLRIRLQDFKKFHDRHNCPVCKGHGMLICPHCNGKKEKKRTFGAALKCGNCDHNGQVKCPECVECRELM